MSADQQSILIFGAGYVGSRMAAALPGVVGISTADIADPASIEREFERFSPDVVINCAGKAGKPNIDWCEGNREETFRSNTLGPLVLAGACESKDIRMVHVGSGCVYEGDNGGTGYREYDPPNFQGNIYSLSKYLSETGLLGFSEVLQLRLRMPVDGIPSPRNLITKIVSYRRVVSVQNSVSILDDFVAAARRLIETKKTGIYNVTNPGAITNPEILEMYRELVDPAFTYEVMPLVELTRGTRVRRSNCVLSTTKLEADGVRLPSIKEAVRNALKSYAGHVRTSLASPINHG